MKRCAVYGSQARSTRAENQMSEELAEIGSEKAPGLLRERLRLGRSGPDAGERDQSTRADSTAWAERPTRRHSNRSDTRPARSA